MFEQISNPFLHVCSTPDMNCFPQKMSQQNCDFSEG